MIEILPDTACMLYVGSMVIMLLLAWVRSVHKERKKILQYTHSAIRCEFCAASFTNTRTGPLSRCPHCGLINNAN